MSANFGVAPLLEGDRSGRPDFARLRRSRRGRLFAAMAEADIDVLVLGRPANIAFASGSRLLWTAGTRPFAPGCVVVAGTGRVHLLSTWDEGVPEELAHDDLFGLSWNPAVVTEAIRAIPGLAEAKVVGTDGWGPGTAQIGRVLFPAARLLDGGPVLARARTVKSVDEVACIATACALAESALTTMIEAATPGVTERQLVAAYAERIASLGSPAPPTEGVACATGRPGGARLRRYPADVPIEPGQLVALSPAAFFGGYEGGLARTVVVGASTGASPDADQSALLGRCRDSLHAIVAACRPGATGAEVVRAGGPAASAEPVLTGIGLGVEPPVIGRGLGAGAVLEAGTVVRVQAWVTSPVAGGALESDTVLVSDDGPVVLSRYR